MDTKIRITIQKEKMLFSIYKKEVEKENLNNTNVIDTRNLKFSIDYIVSNMELIASFLNVIIIKNKVTTVVIKNMEIAKVIVNIVNKLPDINKIIFMEDKSLDYSITAKLLENKKIKKIECYNMPEVMFLQFPENTITTRCEILFVSDFMKINNIKTYSDLFNKESIIINDYLTEQDIEDIIYFLKNNHDFKKIYINGYDKKNLICVLKLLNKYKIKNINILVNEEDIKDDIKLIKKLNKKYKVKISIKDKQDNNNFKTMLLIGFSIIMLLILIIILKE